MTLGEIKIEALRLMYINEDVDVRANDVDTLVDDDEYRKYLVNMPGAINRCFADLENKGVLPVKCIKLRASDGEPCGFGRSLRFELDRLAEDYLAVSRLVYENVAGSCDGDAPYRIEGNTLVLPVFDGKLEEYRLYYHRRISRIKPHDAYDKQIDIPDNIAEYIPYFIKGEIFMLDEPSEAAEAHNFYENGVNNAIRSVSRVSRTYSKYSQVT